MTLSEASNIRVITLLTDFGYKDSFVGQMKGAILSVNPEVKIVDITHDIESHDIEEASYVLSNSYKYFPQRTIHVAVVDPGVGSKRKAVIVEFDNHYFVCPDNGILTYVLSRGKFRAFEIENQKYILRLNSPTFQGRDVFAPAAAWLSKGVQIENFGRQIKKLKTLRIPQYEVVIENKRITKIKGKIILIDKFGNAITNIKAFGTNIKSLRINNLNLKVVNCYSESKTVPAAVINSDGYVEIFQYKGNAANLLKLKKKMKVEVTLDG